MSRTISVCGCPENVMKMKIHQTSSIRWLPMYLSPLSKIYRQLMWMRTNCACSIKLQNCPPPKKIPQQSTNEEFSSILKRLHAVTKWDIFPEYTRMVQHMKIDQMLFTILKKLPDLLNWYRKSLWYNLIHFHDKNTPKN